MQPEDIDKLFRAKLEQHATPPPPSLWYDLQEQLEPEEKKRRGGFWMAIAAAITLLLVAGGGWLVWQGQLPGAGVGNGGTLASRPAPAGPNQAANGPIAPATTNGADFGTEAPRNTPADAASVAANTPAAAAAEAAEKIEKTAPGQATVDSRSASTPQQRQLLARTGSAAAPRETARPETPAQRLAEAAEAAAQQSAVAAQPVTAPGLVPATANSLTAAEPAGAPAPALGTIEVEVRQHPEPAVALAAAPEANDAPGRTRPSVRGVLRQVRRLAQGEKPDLTEVGLPANPALTLQARVAGHTLSKTIAL